MNNLKVQPENIMQWQPPSSYRQITVLDAHTGGEPLRIIVDGLPEIKGTTILEKIRYLRGNLDVYRKLLMGEPRGHADMYGAIITEPILPDSDFGIIFLHNEGYSSMCGHGIIAITKVVLETGLIKATVPETKIKIDSPAGQITAFARMHNHKVESIYFYNVPSYVVLKDKMVKVPGLGDVRFDIAFGGAYYAYVNAADVNLPLTPAYARELTDLGMAIKKAVSEQYTFSHPYEKELSFLYGTIFIGPAMGKGAHSRNVCIFAEGQVDRSPTGTGVSGRLALHYERGELKQGEEIIIESITGSSFKCSVKQETRFGHYKAVIPKVEGTAYICGKNTLLIDPEDPFRDGFWLR